MSAAQPDQDERARIRRRARVRLRQLEPRVELPSAEDADWTRYFEAARIYLAADATGDALLTTEQLAARLGISPETVRARVKDGRLQPVAEFGKRAGYRFRPEARPT
jgi:excisionase family DNA binding protein